MLSRTFRWAPPAALALGAVALIAAALVTPPTAAQSRCRENVKVRMQGMILDVRTDAGPVPIEVMRMIPTEICGVRLSSDKDSKGLQLDNCSGGSVLTAGSP